jgi:hypothetical protein
MNEPTDESQAHSAPDPTPGLDREQRILIAMRQTLGSVIRDLTPPPGMRHPLSDRTIEDVRQCLMLISAREKELADAQGRGGERPHYADEPQTAQTVPMDELRRR